MFPGMDASKLCALGPRLPNKGSLSVELNVILLLIKFVAVIEKCHQLELNKKLLNIFSTNI